MEKNFMFFLVCFWCFEFIPFVGEPRECKGYVAFLPIFGPRGRQGWAANSDFVPFVGDPRECKGYVALPPSFGPLTRERCGSQF